MSSLSSYLTAVILITRWESSVAVETEKNGDSAYKRFVSMLKTSPPITNDNDTTNETRITASMPSSTVAPPTTKYCGEFTYGPTGVSDTAFFRASLGSSFEKVNLIIADIEAMSPQNLSVLITTVADYVIVVDVGSSAAVPSGIKSLEKLRNIIVPA